jgi:hypothetical protein
MINPEELRTMSHPKMQAFFRESTGEWPLPGDAYTHKHAPTGVWYYKSHTVKPADDVIRLPLPIDPRNPERGLEGMLRGPLFAQRAMISVETGSPWVWKINKGQWQPTFTLALLEAIAAQEGIET